MMMTGYGTTALIAMGLYTIATTACIDATAVVDDFSVRLTVTRTITTVVRTVTLCTTLGPCDWLAMTTNSLEEDANHVDNVFTVGLWLANLAARSFMQIAPASCFAKVSAQVCCVHCAGNNTNCLIAVPYSMVGMMNSLLLVDACPMPRQSLWPRRYNL